MTETIKGLLKQLLINLHQYIRLSVPALHGLQQNEAQHVRTTSQLFCDCNETTRKWIHPYRLQPSTYSSGDMGKHYDPWPCHHEPLDWRQHMAALQHRGCGVKMGRWDINFHVVVKVMWCHDHINNVGVSQRSCWAQDQQVSQVQSSGTKEAFKHEAQQMFLFHPVFISGCPIPG